jgi:hypothetical protein
VLDRRQGLGPRGAQRWLIPEGQDDTIAVDRPSGRRLHAEAIFRMRAAAEPDNLIPHQFNRRARM